MTRMTAPKTDPTAEAAMMKPSLSGPRCSTSRTYSGIITETVGKIQIVIDSDHADHRETRLIRPNVTEAILDPA